jgi:hypothetical protein
MDRSVARAGSNPGVRWFSNTQTRVRIGGMAKTSAHASQADFLVMSFMSAVVPMIKAKCGTLNKRDANTLKRRIEKVVREFVKGGQS